MIEVWSIHTDLKRKCKPLKWKEVLSQVNFLASSPYRTIRLKTAISIHPNMVEFR